LVAIGEDNDGQARLFADVTLAGLKGVYFPIGDKRLLYKNEVNYQVSAGYPELMAGRAVSIQIVLYETYISIRHCKTGSSQSPYGGVLI